MNKPISKKTVAFIVVGILVLFVLVLASGAASSSSSTNGTSVATPTPDQVACATPLTQLQAEATPVDYKQLTKDPTPFNGKIATFKGQILQIQQSGNDGIARISVTNEGYGIWSSGDVIYVTYHQPTAAVQGDIVSVTGTLTGSETYTSEANFQITIPSMDVCSITTQPTKTGSQSKSTNVTGSASATTNQSSAKVNPVATTPSPAATPASWHTVGTYSGQTQKNTSPFSIKGSQWRITWQETGDGYFGANAESPDNSGDYCAIANSVGAGSDSTYCYTPGTYYLSVNTANSWTMTVEDYY